MKRALSLRWWLIGGIIAMVVTTYAGVGLLAGLNEVLNPAKPLPLPEINPSTLEPIIQKVESASADQWSDPVWQRQVAGELASQNVAVTLTNRRQSVLWMNAAAEPSFEVTIGPEGLQNWVHGPELQRDVIYQNGRFVGEAKWTYAIADWERPDKPWWRENLASVMIPAAIVGMIWFWVTLASRAILRPLAVLSAAARRINQGELEFDVPASRIKELNEFSHAFDQMRAGLKESITKQANMEQERRVFVAAVAHDLRTPLSSIRGYLEGLRDGVAATPEKAMRYVTVALEKTGALERLIESFFAFTKAEFLDQPLQLESLSLGALLETSVDGLRPRAKAKGVRLTLDEGPEEAHIRGDKQMLGRVIDNLLDNALRYTPEGGVVTVGWRAGVEYSRFWVHDNGPGIPPEDLPLVFKPLYRGDRARSASTGGAGLGLAIARRLVEAHGGTIEVTNDGGARFVVTLSRA